MIWTVLAMLLLIPTVAQAQRTFVTTPQDFYVAENGADTGLCSQSAPCKTIDYAHKVSATQFDYGATCGPTIHLPLGTFTNGGREANFVYQLVGGGCFDGAFIGGPRTLIVGDNAAMNRYVFACAPLGCIQVNAGHVFVNGITCSGGMRGNAFCLVAYGQGSMAAGWNIRLVNYDPMLGQAFGFGEGGAVSLGTPSGPSTIQVITNLQSLLTGSTLGRGTVYPQTMFSFPLPVNIQYVVDGEMQMVVTVFGGLNVNGVPPSGTGFICAGNSTVWTGGVNWPGTAPGFGWTNCIANGYRYTDGGARGN